MPSRRLCLSDAAALPTDEPVQACALRQDETAGVAPLLIDSHVHVWKADPRFPFAQGASVPEGGDASAERLIQLMKANGVSRTVLIQVIHYKWDNSYLASVLKQYPQYFHGVARVDPVDPAAPDQLDQLTEAGFRGVRLSPAGGPEGDWIAGPLMPPLWARCEQLKVPMTVLMPATRLPEVTQLIDRYPALTVVIDHMADTPLDKPEQLATLLALARYPNVYVKISHLWSLSKQAYPYRDTLVMLKEIYQTYGAKRLMWGTDYPVSLPYSDYAGIVAFYRHQLAFMSAEDREEVWHGTVQRVWPFKLA